MYELFRDYTKHEDDLINHRVTWLAQIHGFLYATYGFCLQKKLEIVQQIASHIDGWSWFPDHVAQVRQYMQRANLGFTILEIDFFMLFISFIGLFLSFASRKSLKAAGKSQVALVDLYRINLRRAGINTNLYGAIETYSLKEPEKDQTIETPLIVGGGIPGNQNNGLNAPYVMPVIFLVGWLTSILYFAIDIYMNGIYIADALNVFWKSLFGKDLFIF